MSSVTLRTACNETNVALWGDFVASVTAQGIKAFVRMRKLRIAHCSHRFSGIDVYTVGADYL